VPNHRGQRLQPQPESDRLDRPLTGSLELAIPDGDVTDDKTLNERSAHDARAVLIQIWHEVFREFLHWFNRHLW
jgi:hypothetical protein